jgi:hypothetical protein
MFCICNILVQNVNAPEPSEAETLTLKTLTIIGSILSMVGLVLTILTMVIFKYVHGILLLITLFLLFACTHTYRKLRKRDVSKFNIQLCLAMFLMLLVFVIGVERTENPIGCTIASVLIQYFTLASVFWMGAEAVLMFKKLIIVFGRISTTFIVITSLICWGKCKYYYHNNMFICAVC